MVEFKEKGKKKEKVMRVDTLESNDNFEIGTQTMDKTIHVTSFKRVQEGDYKIYTLYVPTDQATQEEPKEELKPY